MRLILLSKIGPMRPSRIRAKGWFLTYPKCDVTPQAALEYLKEKFTIEEYVIAQEEHKDGTLHLHAFIKV